MKKILLLPGLVFSIAIAIADSHPGNPITPVVFVLDPTILASSKSSIKSGNEIFLPAYKQLIRDAEKALKFGPVSVMEKKNFPPSGDKHDYMSLAPYFWPDPNKPNGLPYIRKDGETNPEVKEYKDKEYMPKLCETIETLGLAYYFSDESNYAEHAAKLLKVWFLDTATRMNPNLNFGQAIKGTNDGRGAGMIDARHFIKLIDGIGLLKGSKFWSDEDQQGMKNWFTNFLLWMQTSKNGVDELNAPNNHGVWYDALRLSMALFTGNTELSKTIIASAENRLDKQMNANGEFPKELERTTSLHYTTFVMEAFFNIARMSEKVGIDFWSYNSPAGNSLKKGFNALAPYLTKEKEWSGQQIKDFEFEEGYPLLLQGYRFGCKKCKDQVKLLAGNDASRMRMLLLY